MMHVSTDYLVYPLHVIPQLFQVLNVPITDLADDKVALARLPAGHEGHLSFRTLVIRRLSLVLLVSLA